MKDIIVNKQPLVSVIIPVYNVCRYLEQCLNSVIAQDYENLEILAVDDGSTDGSGAILDQYAEKDSRVHVIHTENRGLSAARNTALDLARGKYIAFLDSDDWMEPNAIDLLVRYILQYGADIVVCRSYREWMNETKPSQITSGLLILDRKTACYELVCQRRLKHGVWNKLYRAELFEQIRFPEGRVYEDVATTYRLIEAAEKVVMIPDMLFHYRMRQNSISHSRIMKNDQDRWRAFYEMYTAWSGKGEQYRNRLMKSCVISAGRIWFSYPEYIKQTGSFEYAKLEGLYHEIHEFLSSHRREILKGDYSLKIKLICVLSLCEDPVYLKLLGRMNAARRALRKRMRKSGTKEMFP